MRWTDGYGSRQQNPLEIPLIGTHQANVLLQYPDRPTVGTKNVSLLLLTHSVSCLPCSTLIVPIQDQPTVVHSKVLITNLGNRLPSRTHSFSSHIMRAYFNVKKAGIPAGDLVDSPKSRVRFNI